VCGARSAAAHACAPGLSTGRRLMPMPIVDQGPHRRHPPLFYRPKFAGVRIKYVFSIFTHIHFFTTG
jgi:hypothetical protein